MEKRLKVIIDTDIGDDIDDAFAVALAQKFEGGAGDGECGFEVEGDEFVELFCVCFIESDALVTADVVDQKIDFSGN